METVKTTIDFEAYDKIVNLLQSFYLQGFEDAASCPKPVDMSEDIKTQLDIAGIQSDADFLAELNKSQDECPECGEFAGVHHLRCSWGCGIYSADLNNGDE